MLCGGSKYDIHNVNVHVHIMNGVYKAELEDLNSLMMKHWICTVTSEGVCLVCSKNKDQAGVPAEHPTV